MTIIKLWKKFIHARNERDNNKRYKLVGIISNVNYSYGKYVDTRCSVLLYENKLGERKATHQGDMPKRKLHKHTIWHDYVVPWLNNVNKMKFDHNLEAFTDG